MTSGTKPTDHVPENGGKSIWQKLLAGIQSAVELRIVTYVGDVQISGDFCSPQISFPAGKQENKAIVTCLNLAQGDITSCFPEEYLSENRIWLRTYHSEQVKQGRDVVERNLRLIGELGSQVAAAITNLRKVEEKELS